jgi:exodeoxyribonuclease V alpha subunit
LNRIIREFANPPQRGKAQLQVGDRIFRAADRGVHRGNTCDLGVLDGDIGIIRKIDREEPTSVISFFPDKRPVQRKREDIPELDLSYAITTHKSRGSEFGAVIIPTLTQHFKMLVRNLTYTGLTRAKKNALFCVERARRWPWR